LIHTNSFINNNGNSKQAFDDKGKVNNWNNGTLGNYWSDWTSPDKNQDGIVDIPYNISGSTGSKDYHPLTTKIDIEIDQPQPNQTQTSNQNASHQSTHHQPTTKSQ